MSEAKRCSATRKDGAPCGSWALGSSGLCFTHDPARQAERDQARRAGGHGSARRERLRGMIPARLIPVWDRLAGALDRVEAGSMTPAQGQAMASLARALVSVLQAGELEERVRKLEGEHGET